MKASGAPETGDLVRLKSADVLGRRWWDSGLIIECRGIDCLVLWSKGPQLASWFPRNKLEVISESR